ncbi:MAG: tetratricopeptide repeat protein [Verrucomicrobiota bacterium]
MKAKLSGLAIGVGLLALALHWPAVRNGFTHWDDNLYLELAGKYRVSWAGVWWAFTNTYIYYHPLTWLSHGLDCAVWGLQPAGHHAQSVVWHALNAGLVVVLAWQLSKWAAPWDDLERLCLAGWVGLVFAVHPLQVEAVAWVAGRKTLVSAFFSLLALCAYVRWAAAEEQRRWWWAMVAAYVAALLSKPMAVPLPVVFLALDIFPLRRTAARGWGKLIREKWLLFGLAGFVSLLTIIGQTGTGALSAIQMGPGTRVLVAMRSLVFYVWKLAWPAWLSPFYPLGEWNDLRQPEFIVPAVLIVGVTALLVGGWRRWPAGAAAGLAYLAWVLPVSGVLQAGGQAVADRFAYLPVVPALLLMAGGLVWLRQRLGGLGKGVLLVAVGGHLIWLCARTQEQIPVWQDDVTLWQAVIAHYPNSPVEHRFVAQALIGQERFAEALPYAEISFQQQTGDAESRKLLGAVYHDIAVSFVKQREFGKCLPVARRAVELNGADAVARAAVGLSLLKLGQPAEAARELEQVVQQRADLPAVHYNLACAYAGLGRLPAAAEMLRLAVAADPSLAKLAARDPALAAIQEVR